MIPRICTHCDGSFQVRPYKVRQGRGKFCSQRCHYAAARLKQQARTVRRPGYVITTYRWARSLGHPKGGRTGWVKEHLLVAEAALGHSLPDGAEIHHVDGNGWNNANSNLVICQDMAYQDNWNRIEARYALGMRNAEQSRKATR